MWTNMWTIWSINPHWSTPSVNEGNVINLNPTLWRRNRVARAADAAFFGSGVAKQNCLLVSIIPPLVSNRFWVFCFDSHSTLDCPACFALVFSVTSVLFLRRTLYSVSTALSRWPEPPLFHRLSSFQWVRLQNLTAEVARVFYAHKKDFVIIQG